MRCRCKAVGAFALRRWRACCDILDDWRLVLLIAGVNGLPVAQHRNDDAFPFKQSAVDQGRPQQYTTAYASRGAVSYPSWCRYDAIWTC